MWYSELDLFSMTIKYAAECMKMFSDIDFSDSFPLHFCIELPMFINDCVLIVFQGSLVANLVLGMIILKRRYVYVVHFNVISSFPASIT